MKIFKLVLLIINVIFISSCLKAGTWAEDMMGKVESVYNKYGFNRIFGHLKEIEEYKNVICCLWQKNEYPEYHDLSNLLSIIIYLSSNEQTKDRIFKATIDACISQQESTEAYNGDFGKLLACIKKQAGTIDQGLHAFKKAQEGAAYYNDNEEWLYDDYVGGYTVEDFLNEEDSEEVEELRAANDIENIVPMSESGSDSAQDSMKNSKEVSPEKGNPQSRISDFNSKDLGKH